MVDRPPVKNGYIVTFHLFKLPFPLFNDESLSFNVNAP